MFGKVEDEIRRKQNQLQTLQDSMVTKEDVRRERVCREELEELLDREELMWAQKVELIGFFMVIGIQDIFRQWLDKEGLKTGSFKLKMRAGS